MLHSLRGTFEGRRGNHVVVGVHGVGFKIFPSESVLSNLPATGAPITLSCFLYVREDALELYGFSSDAELELFEKLNTVNGIGPKSAMAILGVTSIERLVAAINDGKAELLTKVSGIGRKTAERVVLELKGKLEDHASPQLRSLMESDAELEDTLVSLGYTKSQAREAIAKIEPEVTSFKERLKAALRKTKQ